jgi:hypothetical protein
MDQGSGQSASPCPLGYGAMRVKNGTYEKSKILETFILRGWVYLSSTRQIPCGTKIENAANTHRKTTKCIFCYALNVINPPVGDGILRTPLRCAAREFQDNTR